MNMTKILLLLIRQKAKLGTEYYANARNRVINSVVSERRRKAQGAPRALDVTSKNGAWS